MADANLIDTIGSFMSRVFAGRTIAPDEDIFESGFGNSLFAMQLVSFVERDLGVEIDSDDLDIDNFRTIARVAALVERKRAVAGSIRTDG